jgi:hypothetical protein
VLEAKGLQEQPTARPTMEWELHPFHLGKLQSLLGDSERAKVQLVSIKVCVYEKCCMRSKWNNNSNIY